MPIFSNRRNRTAVNKARLEEANSRLSWQDLQKTLLREVESAYLDALSAQSQYRAATEKERYARESFDLTQEQFNLGVKNTVELITAQNEWASSRQEVLQAKYMALLNIELLNIYQGSAPVRSTENKQHKMKRKRILIAAAVVIAAIVLWLVLRPSKGEGITLETTPTSRITIRNSVTATGTVEPVTEVEVGTQVSGIIDRLYVDYNDVVKAGQLIAEMDKVTLQAELESAQAELATARPSTTIRRRTTPGRRPCTRRRW